jgi:hypothetical protein
MTDDIYGYRFGDDRYCPDDLRTLFAPLSAADRRSTEAVLDDLAREAGFDRSDESSFGPDDFPQPLHARDITEADACVICDRRLLDLPL